MLDQRKNAIILKEDHGNPVSFSLINLDDLKNEKITYAKISQKYLNLV